MTKTAILFTGQGSQISGMGKDFYDNFPCAKEVFETFDRVLNKNISELCFSGSENDLKQTINTQPCILAVELAILESFKYSVDIKVDYVAGHSLGEYAALYAAGVLNLDNTIKLIQARANAMSKINTGSMSAVIGAVSKDTLLDIIKEVKSVGYVDIANYNTPEQTVITGETEAVQKFGEAVLQKGAKKVIPLAVSGAFHSKMTEEASQEFKRTVDICEVNDAVIPVITNVDAKLTVKKDEFKPKMVSQIYSSVRWVQTLEYMKEQGVTDFIEIGPKKIISGLVKKTLSDVNISAICNFEDLNKVVEQYKVGV